MEIEGLEGKWIRDGRIGEEEIGEGGFKGIILCFGLTQEKNLGFTVPPVVPLLN